MSGLISDSSVLCPAIWSGWGRGELVVEGGRTHREAVVNRGHRPRNRGLQLRELLVRQIILRENISLGWYRRESYADVQ